MTISNIQKHITHYQLITYAFLTAITCLTGCSTPGAKSAYSAAPIGARIVDRETNRPIAGAVVVAAYVLQFGYRMAPLHYEETVTDKDGKFYFEGFDTKPVPYNRVPRSAALLAMDPALYILHPNYIPSKIIGQPYQKRPFSHRVNDLDNEAIHIGTTVDGKRIFREDEWKYFATTLSESIGAISSTGSNYYTSNPCAYSKIPHAHDFFIKKNIELSLKGNQAIGDKIFTEQINCN